MSSALDFFPALGFLDLVSALASALAAATAASILAAVAAATCTHTHTVNSWVGVGGKQAAAGEWWWR